jgi:hypothetical protein
VVDLDILTSQLVLVAFHLCLQGGDARLEEPSSFLELLALASEGEQHRERLRESHAGVTEKSDQTGVMIRKIAETGYLNEGDVLLARHQAGQDLEGGL